MALIPPAGLGVDYFVDLLVVLLLEAGWLLTLCVRAEARECQEAEAQA